MHSVRLAQRREQLVGGAARSGDLLLLDLPDLCEMAPRRGIVDAPVAGELIGFLPVLAAALSVALPGQATVAGEGPALPAEGERDVDESERVGNSLRLLLWPAARERTGSTTMSRPPFARCSSRYCMNGGMVSAALPPTRSTASAWAMSSSGNGRPRSSPKARSEAAAAEDMQKRPL